VVEGIFDLSNNIGIVSMETPGKWYVKEMIRSFTDAKIDVLANQIASYFTGADVTLTDRFSPWSPDINSPLIVYSRKVYQDIHGYPIDIFIVGGGVEASMFSVTYPDIQIICYGPTILDAHTIRESVEISTIENTWKYTLSLLRQINELK
jgi:dipeptidase D